MICLYGKINKDNVLSTDMMSNAKKLIGVAFSSSNVQPKILVLREYHKDISNKLFVKENAEELAGHNVKAHFVELPYWFNSILAAHRAGKISDGKLEWYFNEMAPATKYEELLHAEFQKIQTLNSVGIPTIAIDVRDGNASDIPHSLKNVYSQAKQFSRDFPESIMHLNFSNSALRNGIPADAISAWLAINYLKGEGNGVVTYGEAHMSGACEYYGGINGILDDALQKQGAKVVDALILYNRDNLHDLQREYSKNQKTWLSKIFLRSCQETSDHRDFLYLQGEDKLLDKEELAKAGVKNPFTSREYPKAEQVYKDYELNPHLWEEMKETDFSELGAISITTPQVLHTTVKGNTRE